MSKLSVCFIINEVCSAIVKNLLSLHVRFPTGSFWQKVVDGFRDQLGFPQCDGAVYGSHTPISPSECPADYYTRKGYVTQ